MYPGTFKLAAVLVAAAASTVSAQTKSECDPTKQTGCPKDDAFGDTPVNYDLAQGLGDLFKNQPGAPVRYDERGAIFEMNAYNQAPTLVTNKYLFFGRVDVEVQAAPGKGIVTSVVLESDDLDEIDWEWIGVATTTVQSNYFGKGITGSFNRGGIHAIPANADATATTHTYTLDWTKEYVRWLIDGQQVRELKFADAVGGSEFPQTPCRLKLGTWVPGSPGVAEGTQGWAGGMADFADGKTYTAIYKSVKITDYANGVKGATSYEYKPGSDGSYQSIIVNTGSGDAPAPAPAAPADDPAPASSTTTTSPGPSPTTPPSGAAGDSRIQAIDQGDSERGPVSTASSDSDSATSTGSASAEGATSTSSDAGEPTPSIGSGSGQPAGSGNYTAGSSDSGDASDTGADDSSEGDEPTPTGTDGGSGSGGDSTGAAPPLAGVSGGSYTSAALGNYSMAGTYPSSSPSSSSIGWSSVVASQTATAGSDGGYATAAPGSSGGGSSASGSAAPAEQTVAQAAGCKYGISLIALGAAGAVAVLAL